MKKTILFSILAIAFAVVFSSCNKGQQYTCSIKIETERLDSDDPTYQFAVESELKNLFSIFEDQLNAGENHKFTVNAKDEGELSNLVKKLCEKAEKKVSISEWEASHTVKVQWCKDEKNYTTLYTTSFGKDAGIYQSSISTHDLEQYSTKYFIPLWLSFTPSDNFYIQHLRVSDDDSPVVNNLYNYSIREDLNNGAGGPYIYLYAASNYFWDDAPISDVIILKSTSWHEPGFSYTYQGRKYEVINYNGDIDGDLNDGVGGKYYLFIMYTTEDNDGWKLQNMKAYDGGTPRTNEVVYQNENAKWQYVPMVDENTGELDKVANCNYGINGNFICLDGYYVK